jgi:hypothetical protein
VVGRLDLIFESADLTSDRDWKRLTYFAEQASPAFDTLALFATWAATELLAALNSLRIRPRDLL